MKVLQYIKNMLNHGNVGECYLDKRQVACYMCLWIVLKLFLEKIEFRYSEIYTPGGVRVESLMLRLSLQQAYLPRYHAWCSIHVRRGSVSSL